MKKFKMLNIICETCELKGKEKQVATYFIYKSNKTGSCYPSVETIAQSCGVSKRTVQRATKALREKDFISINKRYVKNKQTSNEYKLNILLIEEYERENQIIKEGNEPITFKETTLVDVIKVFNDNPEDNIVTEEIKEEKVLNKSKETIFKELIEDLEEHLEENNANQENQKNEEERRTDIMIQNERHAFRAWLYKHVPEHYKYYAPRMNEINNNNSVAVISKMEILPEKIIRLKFVHNRQEPKANYTINDSKKFWEYRVEYPDFEDIIAEVRHSLKE